MADVQFIIDEVRKGKPLSMVTPLDPRLAPVLASERSTQRLLAVVGALMALLGGGFVAIGVTRQRDLGNTVAAVVFGLVFLVPGVLMIRSWLRGPEATTVVRLLSSERANLTAWDVEYLSINGGPTRSGIVLHRRKGMSLNVTLDHDDSKPVIAYVSEMAPRVQN